MKRIKPVLEMIIILFLFILLHNSLVIGLANVSSFFRKDNSSELRIEAYKNKIDLLEKKISEYESSMNALSIYDGSSYILAKIALRNIYDFYDILEIKTDTKVKEGSAVINERGLVGIVTSSSKNTAKVELITGKDDISVKVGESYGILEKYDLESNNLIVMLSNYVNTQEGDSVVTSGLQKIDENIPIGQVKKVVTEGIKKIVYIEPYVDFDELNYLLVIDK